MKACDRCLHWDCCEGCLERFDDDESKKEDCEEDVK